MQLISYQNSSRINGNHWNNVLTVATDMMTSSWMLLWHGNIHTKMAAQVRSKLHFECFTYAQKDNKITFSMQPVSYWNSSRINGNHQNNILTLATSNDDVIMSVATVITIAMGNDDVSNARDYCGWLLRYHWFSTPLLSKVGIDQLKNRSTLNCFENRH
jgi:hypothetical protein